MLQRVISIVQIFSFANMIFSELRIKSISKDVILAFFALDSSGTYLPPPSETQESYRTPNRRFASPIQKPSKPHTDSAITQPTAPATSRKPGIHVSSPKPNAGSSPPQHRRTGLRAKSPAEFPKSHSMKKPPTDTASSRSKPRRPSPSAHRQPCA